jgi:hypothetical protein
MPTFTTGLGSQLMLVAEAAYAEAPKTPNRSFEYNPGETMALIRPKLSSSQLAAGRAFQSSARTIASTRAGSGAIPGLEVPNQGFGPILNLIHGETVVPAKEAATSVYKQVHKIGTTDPFKKSVLLQLGKPTVEGVVTPFSYPGTVLTSIDFALAVNQWLTCNLTCDANDEITSVGLATFTPPTALESFSFLKAEVKINSVAQTLVRGLTFKIDTPKDTNRFFLNGEKKQAPLTNAFAAASGTITVDYKDAALYKLFEEGKTVPIEFTFTGATVEAIVTELKFVMSACKLNGDSPNVANLGALQQTIPFVVEDDRTNPPVVATYVSKDSAL